MDTLPPAGAEDSAGSAAPRARVLAFYLPQFHPIPENDLWWGKGFTEWTNVARARPLFPGHEQPRLPADLGFYDLRLPEAREAQADLARAHGVEGFCYWHYWFGGGRRILERPFAEVLASGRPDFPFCLAWANQTWSGVWFGDPKHILIRQTYPGLEDERDHFLALLPAFRDPRQIRVDGKPMFIIFAPDEMPDAGAFIEHWRRLAAEHGLPGLFLVGMTNRFDTPAFAGFDALTAIPPNDFINTRPGGALRNLGRLIRERHFGRRFNRLFGESLRRPRRFDYAEVAPAVAGLLPPGERYLPCVLPNWDNTPRSGPRGYVFENATPALFGRYLRDAVRRVADRPAQRRIVFVKAWNEWAEGNYLEPDARHGLGFLAALKAEVAGESPPP